MLRPSCALHGAAASVVRQQVVTAAVLLLLMFMELELVLQQPFDGGGGCDWAVKAVELLVAWW
jgi:hypothetical protein